MTSAIMQRVKLDCFTVYQDRIELQVTPLDRVGLMEYVIDVARTVASPQTFQVGQVYRLTLENDPPIDGVRSVEP